MRATILHGSIRKKLALLFLLSALPAFLVILFFGLKASNESTTAAEQNLKHFTRELADTQARTTASVKLLLETLAKVPEVRQANAPACVELFASLMTEHPHLTTINLVGASGDLIASATGARQINFAHTRHFQNALKRKRFATGEYLVGVTVKVPVFAFAYPLLDKQGQPKYFLLTSIRLDVFDRQFQKMSFPADSFVGACDHRGLRLYRHPENSEVPLGQPIRKTVFEAVTANPEGLIEDTGSDGISRIVAYSALRLGPDEPPYMYVFSGVPKSAIVSKARSELIDNMGLFLLAVGLALVSGWVFGGRALGTKLEEMATASNRLGAGEHSVRVEPDSDIAEIATLAKSFNSMAESLALDIADRKKAQEELRESQEHLNSIFRVAPTGIGVVKDRILVQVNQRFCDMTGYAKEELLGQSARMVYPSQEDFDYVGQEKYRQIGEKGAGEVETRWRRKDGAIIDVFLASTPLDSRDLSLGVTFTATDITERKKAEEALRESEERFRNLFENAPLPYQSLDENGRFLDVNRNWLEALGYGDKEQVLGKWFGDFLAPGYREHFDLNFPMFKHACVIDGVEFKMLRKDGESIHVSFNGRVQTDREGRFVRTHCIFTDVTARKKAEEELHRSESRYQHFSSLASDFFHICTRRGGEPYRIAWIGGAFKQVTGHTPEELFSAGCWLPFVSPEDAPRVATHLTFLKPGETYQDEYRIVRKDGGVRWLRSKCRCEHGDGPDEMLLYGTALDITDRKQAEEALRESETRFRMLFDDVASVAVQGYDQNRTVVYWNQTSTRLYGYSREEALGRKLEDLIIPPPMRPVVIESVRAWVEEDRAIPAGELDLMRKDGSTIAVYSSHIIQRFHDGASIMYCLDIDLSELSEARAELVRAKEIAEAANKSKSLFLANMSHELRTPLNGVLGMLQAIRGFGVSGEVEVYTEMALRAGQRLTGLLGDILDLSRIEAGRMPIASKPFALADIFAALAETFSPMHYSKSLSLVITASPDAPAQVVGDEIRVRQILFNLVGNAMKFSEKGEVRVDVSPLLPHPSGQARLLFSISDMGLGIPDDQIDEICRPFIQVSTDFTRSHQGAGLGLSIARRLIEAMGGTLTFESTEGQGTNVYLVLPFGIPGAPAVPAAPEPLPGADSGASLRLLLVEDDEISRLSARVSLEKMGHRVVTANNGGQALEALRGSLFDCVLMDVQMDAMDGEEATRRIRSGTSRVLDAQVPIIAMTAYAMPGDRERFLQAGMDDYVAKPVQVEELKKALGRVAAARQPA